MKAIANTKIMKLQSFEQTAAYHAKAADIAFMNGNVDTAISHLKVAFYSASNNRPQYLSVVSSTLIDRYDYQEEQTKKNDQL